MPKYKKILIQISINQADYETLTKYGFMMERNINDYLNQIAKELRRQERQAVNDIPNGKA